MTDTANKTAAQGWRSRTVERSLQTARERAVKRGSRYIAAAQELLAKTNRPDFTLQDVVDQSRSSMRTFYLHFASKDDLLLAVLEEEIVAFVDMTRKAITASKSKDPLEHLNIMVKTLMSEISSESSHGRVSRALSIYYMRLFESNPEELAHVMRPWYELTLEILRNGVDAGTVRDDISAEKLAELVMRVTVSTAHSQTLGGRPTGTEPITAADAWRFCLGGVSQPGQ
ncbi:TetR/AcrR family transcriptional regulator [Mycolicibacterium sp. XJ1819]